MKKNIIQFILVILVLSFAVHFTTSSAKSNRFLSTTVTDVSSQLPAGESSQFNRLLSGLDSLQAMEAIRAERSEDVLVEAPPESVGMSSEKLKILDSYFRNHIHKNWLPGGVFLVARKGKIVYYSNYGHRTVKKVTLYQKDDIFRIASMTKAITTVGIMQLYEQGRTGFG